MWISEWVSNKWLRGLRSLSSPLTAWQKMQARLPNTHCRMHAAHCRLGCTLFVGRLGQAPVEHPRAPPAPLPRLAARPHACSPPMTANEDGERLARLRAEAEAEMRRRLPTEGGGRAAKRRKTGGEEAERQAGGRFDYGAIQELTTGITGFLLTCQLQR